MDQNSEELPIKSPCTKKCRIADNGYCRACWRTIEEIRGWRNYSNDSKLIIIAAIEERKIS